MVHWQQKNDHSLFFSVNSHGEQKVDTRMPRLMFNATMRRQIRKRRRVPNPCQKSVECVAIAQLWVQRMIDSRVETQGFAISAKQGSARLLSGDWFSFIRPEFPKKFSELNWSSSFCAFLAGNIDHTGSFTSHKSVCTDPPDCKFFLRRDAVVAFGDRHKSSFLPFPVRTFPYSPGLRTYCYCEIASRSGETKSSRLKRTLQPSLRSANYTMN